MEVNQQFKYVRLATCQWTENQYMEKIVKFYLQLNCN